jgi:hypothetical protein
VILFKGCPRCEGDIDATHRDDVYCIQCGHRPLMPLLLTGAGQEAAESGTLRAKGAGTKDAPARPPSDIGGELTRIPATADSSCCPRCDSAEHIRLDKLRPMDNACYRCHPCGHIFSPALFPTREAPPPRSGTP